MYTFLLAVLVLDGIFMSVVILLQSGKGGGLAAVGGGASMTEGVLGGRQATTVLTRATWISGTIFLVLALVLSVMSSRSMQPESVIQVDAPSAAPAPVSVVPGLGEEPTQGTTSGTTEDPGNSGN